jgi:hypothetical protein
MKKLSMLVIGVLILSGCATPYKGNGLIGGYSDMRIQDNIFRISFRGNGYTSAQKTMDFALLHSAEVTLKNGYKYFIVIDQNQSAKQLSYTTPVTANTTGMVYPNGMYSGQTNYSGGETFNISKHRSSLTIACFVDRPQTGAFAYDAQQVLSNIGAAYGMHFYPVTTA